MLRLIGIAFSMSISVTLLWGGYTIDHSQGDFSFYKDHGFDRIKAKGFTNIGEPGSPELPSIYLKYIIPPTAKVESLVIKESSTMQISGQFLIYPTQPPFVQGEIPPWVPPDPAVYNSSALYPEKFIEVVGEGVMDGARIVTVAVHPIQYISKLKKLSIVTHIEFEFVFGMNTLPEVRSLKRGIYEQSVHDAALRSVITNDYEIPLYYQKPMLVEEKEFLLAPPTPPMGPSVIITDSSFFNAFQPYADWLTDQGIPTFLISPKVIYGYSSGRDYAEKIRNYIKECYTRAGGTYFILGGVDNRFLPPVPPEVPARRCFCHMENPAHPWYSFVPTDYYYCALDGDWNVDGDTVWGEMDDSVDQEPEVYVGRILCSSVQEVSNWVYKALKYEKLPANINSLDTAAWIWQNGDSSNQWYLGDAIDEFPDHFTHIVAENYSASDAFNLLNHGHGFTHGQTHGNLIDFPTGWPGGPTAQAWVHSSWLRPPQPGYNHAGLNWLTNDDRYYIHYSVSCHLGFFDGPPFLCIAEAFVDSFANRITGVPVGACASIEHTRYSYGPASAYSFALQIYYYEQLFSLVYSGVPGEDPLEASSERIGVALATAKDRMPHWRLNWCNRFVCYSTNLFGSPTTDAWTNVPGNFSVSHPTSIPTGSAIEFQVVVTAASTGNPLAKAKVCLNKPGDIYAVGRTDANGQVTFIINPKSEGTMKVTVTRLHNYDESYTQYLPSQTNCRVLYSPDGEQSSGSDDIMPDHLCITQMPTFCSKMLLMKYGIPIANAIDLVIYDIAGSRILMKKIGSLRPGYYEERIDLADLSNGVYYMVIRQGKEKVTKKFLVVR